MEAAYAWAVARGAQPWWAGLAAQYWELSPWCGDVSSEVAYVQACKETGFGHFGRAVTREHHNPCGLKIHDPKGLADNDPNAHQRFPSWQVGVTAHLDHLALYAGAAGYPRRTDVMAGNWTPDPRHFASVYAKARTVEELGGKWAPSPSYGVEIATLVTELRDYWDEGQ